MKKTIWSIWYLLEVIDMIRNDIFDKVAGGSAHFLEHIDTDLEGFYRLEDRIKYLKVDFFSLSIS